PPALYPPDGGLALHGHLVDAAITIVDDLLQVLHPRGRIPLVAGIGAGDSVAFHELRPHVRVLDVAGEAVVAKTLELAVPALKRQPHLELDLPRPDRALNAAECRQLRARRCPTSRSVPHRQRGTDRPALLGPLLSWCPAGSSQ